MFDIASAQRWNLSAASHSPVDLIESQHADVPHSSLGWWIGLAIFAGGSVLSGAASSEEALIAGRVVQGIGAAAMLPLSLAIVSDAFPGDQQARASGIWAAGAVGARLQDRPHTREPRQRHDPDPERRHIAAAKTWNVYRRGGLNAWIYQLNDQLPERHIGLLKR